MLIKIIWSQTIAKQANEAVFTFTVHVRVLRVSNNLMKYMYIVHDIHVQVQM